MSAFPPSPSLHLDDSEEDGVYHDGDAESAVPGDKRAAPGRGGDERPSPAKRQAFLSGALEDETRLLWAIARAYAEAADPCVRSMAATRTARAHARHALMSLRRRLLRTENEGDARAAPCEAHRRCRLAGWTDPVRHDAFEVYTDGRIAALLRRLPCDADPYQCAAPEGAPRHHDGVTVTYDSAGRPSCATFPTGRADCCGDDAVAQALAVATGDCRFDVVDGEWHVVWNVPGGRKSPGSIPYAWSTNRGK